jgi:hypothetical protein
MTPRRFLPSIPRRRTAILERLSYILIGVAGAVFMGWLAAQGF